MARPRTIKHPARLHLLVERESKRNAFKLADARDVGAGELFEQLVAEEQTRIASNTNSKQRHISQHSE